MERDCYLFVKSVLFTIDQDLETWKIDLLHNLVVILGLKIGFRSRTMVIILNSGVKVILKLINTTVNE